MIVKVTIRKYDNIDCDLEGDYETEEFVLNLETYPIKVSYVHFERFRGDIEDYLQKQFPEKWVYVINDFLLYDSFILWRDFNQSNNEKMYLKEKGNYNKQLNHILKERGDNYGKFSDNCICTNFITKLLEKNHPNVDPVFLEGLHMITHKISRLINGDITHKDSYLDIIGYATLIIQHLEKKD